MKTYNAKIKTQFISWETYPAKRRIDNGEDRFETYEKYDEHYMFETEQNVIFVVLDNKQRAYIAPNKDESKVFVNYIPNEVEILQDEIDYIIVWKDKKTVIISDKHYNLTKALYVPKYQFVDKNDNTNKKVYVITKDEYDELYGYKTQCEHFVNEEMPKVKAFDKLMAEKAKRKAAREAAKKNK